MKKAGLGSNKLTPILLVTLLIVIIGTLVLANRVSTNDKDAKQRIKYVDDLRVLSQEIAKNASEASIGEVGAFPLLKTARNEFDLNWGFIRSGNSAIGFPGYDKIKAQGVKVEGIESIWNSVRTNADSIIESEETIIQVTMSAEDLSDSVVEMQNLYNFVVEELINASASGSTIALAQSQTLVAEKMLNAAEHILTGGHDANEAADEFETHTLTFTASLDRMISGNDRIKGVNAQKYLKEIQGIFNEFKSVTDGIIAQSVDLEQVQNASSDIFTDSRQLLRELSSLSNKLTQLNNSDVLLERIVWALAALAGFIILIIGYNLFNSTRKDLRQTEEMNDQNQNAILRLLDELADLADGDLTTSATVTEDFTGAIADSINYAIDQMRALVSAINATAVQVSSAAQETQATAMHLAEASEHQAQEIAGASAAVNEMAVSIDQVSANAAESTAVAERSVAIAKKGSDVVQATINGMDNIREQIQETSKRIKRLGESSQEIGDIVSLINDIADQTNILALNAAIQASMAGDAGRGFAVVADEVQRLAERSSSATKQIEALVKTIQNDTNEAVISMEQTTSEVVRGARLAQDAGVALEEIENVSKSLADLIQNISNAARQQASSAGHISNTMNVIQEITSQTSSGTTATAKSIGNLAQLANEMRASVAGFKLPEDEDGEHDLEIEDLDDEELLSI
ncbi:methyl-accepting chemotaxis protein [Marinicellulosiphila megalodicopiae]|uniref:methyl-accepting chemotaxis protein n=1 Tax=Marinicellulosiphila megalodicopiae TaxID=2724896 RepID=UPI003BAED1EB